MNFCSHCGNPVEFRIPPGDHLPRFVCPRCGTIHYENPLNVVGTVPEWDGRVLLCLRNIEPRKGFWTLPAGFMELDETTEQGAVRETVEESGARIVLGPQTISRYNNYRSVTINGIPAPGVSSGSSIAAMAVAKQVFRGEDA